MSSFKTSLSKFGYLEQLAANGTSSIHRLNRYKNYFKFDLYYFVVTVNYFDVLELLGYLGLIIIMILWSKVSFYSLLKRSLIGLPITLCIGISNLFSANSVVDIDGVLISSGVLSLITIVLKNILCLFVCLFIDGNNKI